MGYYAVHIICSDDLADTISFLLQEQGFLGSSYEKGRLIAYSDELTFSQAILDEILTDFDLVAEQVNRLEHQNWNQIWEDNFQDADLGEHIHARAPFHPAKEVKHDIIISPKMAFGTGHHETTRLSAIALEKLDCTGKTVLDMGCGSGLLAILASQKKASKVVAIDYDIHSVDNTRENVQLNDAENVDIVQVDNLNQVTEKFDIIVSNIVKNINLRLLPEFAQKLNYSGRLILSGFLEQDLEELKTAAMAQELKFIQQATDNGWLQTQFIKKNE